MLLLSAECMNLPRARQLRLRGAAVGGRALSGCGFTGKKTRDHHWSREKLTEVNVNLRCI